MRRRFGSSNNLTGSTAGVWGVYVNNSNNTGLTNANWYSCSYGFAICKLIFSTACVLAAVICGSAIPLLTLAASVKIAERARLVTPRGCGKRAGKVAV